MHHSIRFLKTFITLMLALSPIWGVLVIIISVLGVVVGTLEGIGWHDGLYFAWVTGTSVGYGDIVPTTPLTKFLSIVIGVIGIVNTGMVVTIAVTAARKVVGQDDSDNTMKKKVIARMQDTSH